MNDPVESNTAVCGLPGKLTPCAWQSRYESGQTAWDRGGPSPAFSRWLDRELATPGRILVPGCGRGHEVIELARRGFDVTAVDFAEAPLVELRNTLERAQVAATLLKRDMLSFEPDAPFDYVYEQTCLCAIDPENWSRYAQTLANCLRPGGTLLALFLQTDAPQGPPFHCSIDVMKRLFDDQHWDWSEKTSIVPHPTGMHEVAAVLTRLPQVSKGPTT